VCFESEAGWTGEMNLEEMDAWVAYLVAGRP